MKITLVTTILNEEKSIGEFLLSVSNQLVRPDEVIIVDGGSTDNTLSVIYNFSREAGSRSARQISSTKQLFDLRVLSKKGNRSVGRNEGIKQAKNGIILLTDAGCLLDKNWVKEISKPFGDKNVDVVAGYYADKSDTVFQKCLTAYALIMPDKVNPETFLPATRSMALRKHVWEELGGFDPKYSHNEDYVFANKLKAMHKKIVFAKNAIVYWIPRKTFKEAYVMFYRFAYGDVEAKIIRPKVIALFARYTSAALLLVLFIPTKNMAIFAILFAGFILYIIWAIVKNYRYVNKWQAIYFLPLIQFTADAAVLKGSIDGWRGKYGL